MPPAATNRLSREASPYLRQHAHNPVDWYPWGEEAFARARAEDRPVLLSVGYSACHWCHVMAHECFEDDEVAAVMNRHFVNVKVDREERPDVDSVYMDAVQAITGSGGWPMTVFLAPDGRPFHGGTYYPRAQFLQLLGAVDGAWRERRTDLLAVSDTLTEALQRTAALSAGEDVPGSDVVAGARAALLDAADRTRGGFGRAPKFPQTMNLEVLVRAAAAGHDAEAQAVVTTALDAMASGGIYDHLGGGFARYSTDAAWLVPHFEKMLYDQALLLRVYLHAWQVLGHDRWRQVVDETVEYLVRDLRLPGGAFASAEDADSEGEEGRFYVWGLDELVALLGDDTAAAVAAWYGVTPAGNFEGASILHRPLGAELARPEAIEAARTVLLEARARRVRPGLDDKVLTEWNALAVAAVAEAAGATGRTDWRATAVGAAEFLLANLRRADGRWMRSWQVDAGARHLAYAADHGALVDAFCRLAELTGEARWIGEARATADALLALFWDDAEGGVFTTGRDGEQLVARQKDILDNATPSANALAAHALARLGALTGDTRYGDHADAILRLLGPLAGQHPTAFGHLVAALDTRLAGTTEVAVVGDRPDLVRVVQAGFHPHLVLAWGQPYPSPLWEGRQDGKAYVCRNFTCRAPVDSPAALATQLTAP